MMLLVLSCAGSAGGDVGVSATQKAPISLEPAGGEVWAWQVALHGSTEGPELASCRVHANEAWMPAVARGRQWRADVRLEPGRNLVAVECRDRSGTGRRSRPTWFDAMLTDAPAEGLPAAGTDGGTVLDANTSGPDERRESLDRTHPSWIDDAVVYGVVPRLFGSPPLEAVTRSLARLADLGVSVVWLSPVFESPADDFGYAVTDYFGVRRAYGTDDDLAGLVDEAHRLGMRVLLDLVPNHTSAQHRYFQEAAALGSRSHYFDFYARGPSGQATHYFDWLHLPNLNYDNTEVRQWMLQATGHWLRRFHVDGFRVDAAWGIRQRTPAFLGAWVDEVRRINPDTLLIAEASARDPFYFERRFDAAYDWTEEIGRWAWEGMFDHPEALAQRLERELLAAQGRVLRFLDNNDTGERFVTRHGRGMTRVASALLLTLPGLPCLFSGEESGAEYEPYKTHGPIAPRGDDELRDWYRTLVRLRRAHPSLYRGERVPMATAPRSRVVAYLRHDRVSGEAVLVALNFDAGRSRARVELPSRFAHVTRLDDLLGERRYRAAGGVVQLDLPGWGVTALRLRFAAGSRHMQQTVVAPVP